MLTFSTSTSLYWRTGLGVTEDTILYLFSVRHLVLVNCLPSSLPLFLFKAFCHVQVSLVLVKRRGKPYFSSYDYKAFTRLALESAFIQSCQKGIDAAYSPWTVIEIKSNYGRNIPVLKLVTLCSLKREEGEVEHQTNNLTRHLHASMYSETWTVLISVGVRRKSITARKERSQTLKERNSLKW
jgi:hypothetical protein